MAVTFPFMAEISPSFDPCFPSLFSRVVSRGTSCPQRGQSLVGRVGEAPRCRAGLCRLERKPVSGGEGLKGGPGLPKVQSSEVQAPCPGPPPPTSLLESKAQLGAHGLAQGGHLLLYKMWACRQTDIHSGRQKDKIKMIVDGDHWLKLA